eukprot:XP_011662426.1 PREDICTED: antigen WC1.1-like [Strongylocentrotus purpuratus]
MGGGLELTKYFYAGLGETGTWIEMMGTIDEDRSSFCIHDNDAGVECGDGTTTSTFFFQSTSIRLVGGASADEGRVEIYYNGEWGTVCDDSWDDNDAEVVCRQLGLSTYSAVAWTSTGTYGRGTGRILLDEVNCYGYESSLTACSSNGWYNNDCSHHEDAGVRCGPITSPRVIGTMSFVGISLFLLLVIGIVVVCRVCNTKPIPTHIASHGTELTTINNGSTTTNQYTASPSAVTQGTPISYLPPPATAPSTVTVLPPGYSSQSQAPVNPSLSPGARNPETGQSQFPEEHEYLEVNPGVPPPDGANTYQDLDLTHQESSYQDLNQFPEDNDYLEVNPGTPPPDSTNTYQDLDLTHQESSYQDLNLA